MAHEKSNTLRSALVGFELSYAQAPHFGGESKPLSPVPSPEQVQMLRGDLARIARSNSYYFQICVALLLVLFGGTCLFVYKSLADPTHITAAFAATGVSLTGVITQMTRLWKEKVNADLLLALTGTLTPLELQKVVDVLLKSFLK